MLKFEVRPRLRCIRHIFRLDLGRPRLATNASVRSYARLSNYQLGVSRRTVPYRKKNGCLPIINRIYTPNRNRCKLCHVIIQLTSVLYGSYLKTCLVHPAHTKYRWWCLAERRSGADETHLDGFGYCTKS